MFYAPYVTVEEPFVKGAPIFDMIDGNVYWVDSAYGGNQRGTFSSPMTTIDGAVNLCSAGNNDHIFVKAGHAESISTATALNLDIADVAIIGLGNGTDRPTVTLDTANTTTIPVTAANILVKNIIFNANFLNIAALFSLTTAKHFALVECQFKPAGASLNFVDIVDTSTTDNAADGLAIARCNWVDSATGSGSLVDSDADIDGLTALDNYVNLGVNGVLSAVAEVPAGKDTTNINVQRNTITRLVTASAVQVITWADTTTTNTGLCADNELRTLDTAGELVTTAGSNVSFYNNKSSSVAGAGGYLLPAADS